MTRWGAAIALMLPLLAGCTLAAESDCSHNARCAALRVEPSQPGAAVRHGDTLVLSLAAAAALQLTDHAKLCDQEPENCRSYVLMGIFPKAHAFVVQLFYYEGSDFILIDSNTGKQTPLNGTPAFSPDGGEFLVAPHDDENDSGPNNLEIWRRQDDGAVLEWAHTIKQAQRENPALPQLYESRVTRWEKDRITLHLWEDSDPAHGWTGLLVHGAAGWRFQSGTAARP